MIYIQKKSFLDVPDVMQTRNSETLELDVAISLPFFLVSARFFFFHTDVGDINISLIVIQILNPKIQYSAIQGNHNYESRFVSRLSSNAAIWGFGFN